MIIRKSNFITIYHVKSGELVELNKDYGNGLLELVKKETLNLLNKQTLITTFLAYYSKNQSADINKSFLLDLVRNFFFCSNINIILQDSDENKIHFEEIREQVQKIANLQKEMDVFTFYKLLKHDKIPSVYSEKIAKEDFYNYQQWVNNLTGFIKVFKTDLQKIEIYKIDCGDFYECQLIMHYSNGSRINKKYESTGIKKIINLYSALCLLNKGQIVFIDEFDANIHDVLLNKIVQYIVEYADGQFVFTTHNVGVMDTLKNKGCSIDFLSTSSEIVSWIKNGNYSPSNLYKKGLIKLSPFNLEPFDFLGSFGEYPDE